MYRCALLEVELQTSPKSAELPSAEAKVTGSGSGQHCESVKLFIAEIRANVQVRNPAASCKARQPHAIDLSGFLLLLPDSEGKTATDH